MGTITKIKNQYYVDGVNIDANYGPWESIGAYENWLTETIGTAEVKEGTKICVIDPTTHVLQTYLYTNEGWKIENEQYLKNLEESIWTKWESNHYYEAGSYVIYKGALYNCMVSHTSDVFEEDYESNKWEPGVLEDIITDLGSDVNTRIDSLSTTVDALDSEVDSLTSTVNTKYVKPSAGIPSTDLTQTIQTSLAKADNAVSDVRIGGSTVKGEGGIVNIPLDDETAHPVNLISKSYLTTNYDTTTEVDTKIAEGILVSQPSDLPLSDQILATISPRGGGSININEPIYKIDDVEFTPGNNNKDDLNIASITELNKRVKMTAIASEFSATAIYNVGDVVMYNGLRYVCTTEHSTAAWNPDHFTLETVNSKLNLLNSEIIGLTGASYVGVATLPTTGVENTIYLTPTDDDTTFTASIYTNNAWVTLGTYVGDITHAVFVNDETEDEEVSDIDANVVNDAVRFTSQIKSDVLKAQARTNIGAASTTTTDELQDSIDDIEDDIDTIQTAIADDETILNNLSPSIADEFDATSTYAVGDIVMHEGMRYKCTTAITIPSVWDSSKWTEESVQDVLNNILVTLNTLLSQA